MKKVLIRLLCAALICGMINPVCVTADNDDIKIYINEKPIVSDAAPLIENDSTLVPIRTVSENMNCTVNWIAEERTVEIKNDNTVLRMPVDENKYTVNGKTRYSTVSAKIINDRTFVPIRFVAETFNCSAVWDDNERAVYIADYPVYNADSSEALTTLYALNIIDENDVGEEYITTREALKLFRKFSGIKPYLKDWYYGDTFASLDYLDDGDKELLLSLSKGNKPVLIKEDILSIKLEDNLTNCDAIKFIIRMIGNTYGCAEKSEELSFTEKEQIYNAAQKRGLIDEIDMTNADEPIGREEFYGLIYKSLFIEISVGGACGVQKYKLIESKIDSMENKKHNAEKNQTENETITHKISVDYTINDDMSVSWTVPDEYKEIFGEHCGMEVEMYTDDNEEITGYMSSAADTSEDAEWIIKQLITHYPEKAAYLRVKYYLKSYYSDDNKLVNPPNEEWVFDIVLPDIEVAFEGDELKPGVFTRSEGEWIPQTITLADGYSFKKDLYYMITSYEHNYRNDKYNGIGRAIWKAEDNSSVFDNTRQKNSLLCGGLYPEDMHIQEIKVDGSAKSGFTLYVTPISTDKFEVTER